MENNKIINILNIVESNHKRRFDPKVTYAQLYVEPIVVGSWGACNWSKVDDKALVFTVNGKLHKGYVVVVLNYGDLYDFHLLDRKGFKVGSDVCNIFAEDLVWRIDELVETPKDY